MSHRKLTCELVTTGTVGVRYWSDKEEYPFIILLAGPTGSGKSSFIEALANDKSLGISKDQLEGFTQTVTAYLVENMVIRGGGGDSDVFSVCLLDLPGFSDVKISEMEIIEQVKTWLDEPGFLLTVQVILYFCPINATRIPGTQRRTIDMLKSLIRTPQSDNGGSLTIVTTMWDQVCNKQLQQRADDNFAYIRENLFKDMIEGGTGLTAFTNKQKSALSILHSCVKHSGNAEWSAAMTTFLSKNTLRLTPHGQELYSNLLGRIEEAWRRKHSLELELADAATCVTQAPELIAVLEGELQETIQILDKFALQLAEFGTAPDGVPSLQDDLAEYVMQKYGRQQKYAAALVPLEDWWEKMRWMEDLLEETHASTDPKWKAEIEDGLQEAMHELSKLAKRLVDLGQPPDGMSGPQGELAAYIEREPWLENSQNATSASGIMPQPTPVEPVACGKGGSTVDGDIDANLHFGAEPQGHIFISESEVFPNLNAHRRHPHEHNIATSTMSSRLQPPQAQLSTRQSVSVATTGTSRPKTSLYSRVFRRVMFWRK
ncbi:hypothetical protein CVT24_000249 [Panaeolus cyanescens]|uniref:Uncharacterized protein n=1 Tax=Panaeolus cyanescens TaxID=181874 RepID=A0A409YD35_9AGAR|nr:hypothetical protein CVT24_000249 [Panaeolus cyanescens]